MMAKLKRNVKDTTPVDALGKVEKRGFEGLNGK
jgi:hypothetical protein